jgi:HEAT repeat protein
LRKVDVRHQQVYDQYLIEVLTEMKAHWQDVSLLEAAVHAVTQVAKGSSFVVGGASMIAVMAALLEHTHHRVRTAAVNAFPWIAARGDSVAIAAVAERFGHANKSVRHAALNTLAKIAERGNGTAGAIVVAGLEDTEPDVRAAALRATAEIAEKRDKVATAAVVALLEDTFGNVRCAALRTFAQIVNKGDATAIAAVVTRLEDPRIDVRKAAVDTLAQIVEKGDVGAIAAVSVFLTHRDEQVRVAAVYALARIEEKGSDTTISAIAACLDDAHKAVRKAAVEVLPQIAEKGNSAAIVALVASLQDRSVRHAAGEALLHITEGNERTIAALYSITDIKFLLTAALRIPNEGEVEEVAAAAASLEDAKLHLAMRSHYFMMSAQARLGIVSEGNFNGKAPTIVRKSLSAGGMRTFDTGFRDFFLRSGIQNALIIILIALTSWRACARWLYPKDSCEFDSAFQF